MRHRRLTDLTMHFDTDGAVFLRSQAHSLGARVPPQAPQEAWILSLGCDAAGCWQPATRDAWARDTLSSEM